MALWVVILDERKTLEREIQSKPSPKDTNEGGFQLQQQLQSLKHQVIHCCMTTITTFIKLKE
jgi:hypothetical protein